VTDMATPLRIESRPAGEGTAVLALAGEVDVSNTAQVREAALKLLSDGVSKLVIDLTATEYMDSAGLGMLVGLLKRLNESGGKMAIAGARPGVGRLFTITGLNRIFALYGEVATALKEVGG
jgi:anti-sigma B factor antagonist